MALPEASIERLNEVPCPQCAAIVSVPPRVEVFTCPWCGSALRPGRGPRVFRVWQRIGVDRAGAEGAVRAWLAGPDLPRNAEKEARIQVGEREWMTVLRLKGRGRDILEPLGGLRHPAAVELVGLPTAWLFPGEVSPDAPSDGDPDDLAEALARHTETGVTEIILEHRAFYPVVYEYRGRPFAAAVDAGAGTVRSLRQPAVRTVAGAGAVAAVTAVVLFAEALLLPLLALKVAAVLLTAAVLYPLWQRKVGSG